MFRKLHGIKNRLEMYVYFFVVVFLEEEESIYTVKFLNIVNIANVCILMNIVYMCGFEWWTRPTGGH